MRDSVERAARLIACSDGVTRVVLLSEWFWRAHDWLEQERGFNMARLIANCWASAHDAPNPEYEFCAWVEHTISHCVDLCIRDDDGFANDNFQGDFFAPAVRAISSR